MIISQTKRAYYDQQGVIAKVDILKSLRRPNVEASTLYISKPLNYYQQSDQPKASSDIFRQIILAIVILASFLLLLSLIKGRIFQQSTSQNQKYQLEQKSYSNHIAGNQTIQKMQVIEYNENEIGLLVQEFINIIERNSEYTLVKFRQDKKMSVETWQRVVESFSRTYGELLASKKIVKAQL